MKTFTAFVMVALLAPVSLSQATHTDDNGFPVESLATHTDDNGFPVEGLATHTDDNGFPIEG